MSAENPFEHESSPESSGLVAWIKGTRIAKAIHQLNNGRYEEHVPEVYRELGEREGVPLPNRWVPSMQGKPIRLPRDEK